MPVGLWILNGPNLNLLGERETGDLWLDDAGGGGGELPCVREGPWGRAGISAEQPRGRAGRLDSRVAPRRRRHHHQPSGYSFHSIPILDALKVFARPIIELPISNIHAPDELHRHSILSGVSTAVICGLGAYGYIVAMQAAARMVGEMPGSLPEPIRVGPA
jgi:3-dehydroquinate dehydratase-2